MITLTVVNEKETILNFFEQAKLSYNENSCCLWAKSGDEVLGYCLFDIDSEKILIRYIEPLNDLGLADGILRSALHVAAERFIFNAFYDDTVPENFFKKLDFIKDESARRLDIDKLFKSCGSCLGN